MICNDSIGNPQFGQAAAFSEISLPHSGHLIKANEITFLFMFNIQQPKLRILPAQL